MKRQKLICLYLSVALGLTVCAADRPEAKAFPFKTSVTAGGTQIYVAAQKQKNYLSVGTATVADLASTTYYFASNKVVTASGDNVDHSNPKCIKAEGNLTMHGGSKTVYAKVPSMSSSSGSVSLVCTTDGCSSAPSISAVSSPSGTSQNFHGVYFQ